MGLDHATQSLATICAYAWRHAAVLSFSNLSGDAEQEYFADGMVDDIINGLSRMQQIGSYRGYAGHRVSVVGADAVRGSIVLRRSMNNRMAGGVR